MGPLQIVLILAAIIATAAVVYRQLAAVRAAREHNETERFARDIIDNAAEGIVVYDRELRYVLWNDFMKELTGIEAADVLGRPAVEVFPHIVEQRVDELLQRALDGETVSSPDVHYYVPTTGRRGWVSAVYRPYVDGN